MPCHAWCYDFFVSLANSMGSFICLDESSANKSCMDIARIMVRVPANFLLMKDMKVTIYGVEFRFMFREDLYGPVRIARNSLECLSKEFKYSSFEDL